MWKVLYLEEAVKDLKKLDGSQKISVRKAINKVSENPVSIFEGGYGKPLGNKGGNNLTGLLKIKLKSSGIRITYLVRKIENEMTIIVIGFREDSAVYKEAKQRMEKHGL